LKIYLFRETLYKLFLPSSSSVEECWLHLQSDCWRKSVHGNHGSSFLGKWGFVDISFEVDPPRAISPFLFFGGGMLSTSTNLLLTKKISCKSWKVIFLGQWGFLNSSFEGDPPRANSHFLFLCGEMLATSWNWLLNKIWSSKSWKVLFIRQWGFIDISFEGDPQRVIYPFLFFCGGMLVTATIDC